MHLGVGTLSAYAGHTRPATFQNPCARLPPWEKAIRSSAVSMRFNSVARCESSGVILGLDGTAAEASVRMTNAGTHKAFIVALLLRAIPAGCCNPGIRNARLSANLLSAGILEACRALV